MNVRHLSDSYLLLTSSVRGVTDCLLGVPTNNDLYNRLCIMECVTISRGSVDLVRCFEFHAYYLCKVLVASTEVVMVVHAGRSGAR